MHKSAFLLPMLLSFGINASYAQDGKTDENIPLVKGVIEREVDALNRHHNLDEFLACFANSERVHLGPYENKMIIGREALRQFAQKIIDGNGGKPNPSTWTFADWDVRVNGNTAFASCVQTTKTGQGTYVDVLKSDYLEKINGEWKIVDHRYFHTPERKE